MQNYNKEDIETSNRMYEIKLKDRKDVKVSNQDKELQEFLKQFENKFTGTYIE